MIWMPNLDGDLAPALTSQYRYVARRDLNFMRLGQNLYAHELLARVLVSISARIQNTWEPGVWVDPYGALGISACVDVTGLGNIAESMARTLTYNGPGQDISQATSKRLIALMDEEALV